MVRRWIRLQLFACLLLLSSRPLASASETPSITSDVIIIGAGTAGCVLAARLCSANPALSISLFERAQPRTADQEFIVRSPRLAPRAWDPLGLSEVYVTEPDTGLLNRSTAVLTGNTLGGGSTVNAMQWGIPSGSSIQKWGISGFNKSTARTFYERVYDKIGFRRQKKALRQFITPEVLRASQKAGFQKENDPFKTGFRRAVWRDRLAVSKTGRRVDSYTAYLEPVINDVCKSNLKLYQGYTAEKLLFDESSDSLEAIGVKLKCTNRTENCEVDAFANKEIILSSGAFGSPKLLQLSGIGPRKVLKRAGIKQRLELPVGVRTQGRGALILTAPYTGQPLDRSNNSTNLESPVERGRWEAGKRSVFGTSITAMMGIMGRTGYFSATSNFDETLIDVKYLVLFCFDNPSTRGWLRVVSNDAFAAAKVKLSLMDVERDVKKMKICMNKVRNIYKKFGRKWNLTVPEVLTDDAVRNQTIGGPHFVAGCAVGRVVDEDLRVLKTKKLRVVDSSVLSEMPRSAGPMASVYAVAEMMAERLIEEYRS